MGELSQSELTSFLIGLAALLLSAHLFAELARRLGQPAVIGEMIAGVLLGPTFLGRTFVDFHQWLFPHEGPAATALDAIVTLAVILLLMMAGIEVDMSSVWRQGRATLYVAFAAVVFPLAAGFAIGVSGPAFWGMLPGVDPSTFGLVLGTGMAVSALPVIAKILLDLDLLQSDFGVLVLVTATLNNMVAWLVFSIVLGGDAASHSVTQVVLFTVLFSVAMLTIGRWAADRCLIWIQAHFSWPAGVLGFMVVSGLTGAAITGALGVHVIFGAFLTGVAIGESPHMREQTRHVVHKFVEGVLAPVFVVSIGLEVDFIRSFDPVLVASVVLLGTALKVLAVWAGARLGGCQRIEAWGAGWALNARGELGIVLGLVAWKGGVIDERLFVALVTLAMVSSGMAGPALKYLLRREKSWSLGSLLDTKVCLPNVEAMTAEDAIRKLSFVASERTNQEPERIAHAVLERERIMGTGVGRGIAVPHARLVGLGSPVVVVGACPTGVPFEGIDDEPVGLIFLCLTPADDPGAQLQILAAVGRLSREGSLVREAMKARNGTELLGTLRVAEAMQQRAGIGDMGPKKQELSDTGHR